ncbi:MAG: 3-phosphoshikimate 1-carboxyvinyltransferase [Lawsonibacter sp.]|nr:3-phosphoshikimate 1-carboxyvinyltransferase [Lawsonibacter sp.]
MNLRITPGPLEGTVTPPPSKSQAHRAILAQLLAGGGTVSNLAASQDIEATRRCAAALKTEGDGLPLLDCGESGSTLRFLIPIALALRGGGRFTGRGRLMERPQKPYFDIFNEKGISYEQKDGVLTLRGELEPGEYRLPGNVSSQFVTGLLYALPLLDGDSEIVLTSRLEGWGYVDMTLNTLEKFGITTEERDTGWIVPGRQVYQPCGLTVEADWSQAAFWYAAEFLGNSVQVSGMPKYSRQGDSKFVWFNRRLAMPRNMGFSVADCPDLVPPLAAMAALRNGYTTYLGNAARLRIKESDRLSSVTQVLNALGAQVEEGPDFLKITGKDGLAGGVTVDCCNDHRIAMMAAVAATRCREPVTLLGAECVSKSYPNFWDDYRMLGGKFDVL